MSTVRNKAAQRGSAARPFTLWKEVAVAYLAPALSAGIGGVLGGQPELTTAAFTSIGITSAVVAFVVGGWLHRRGRPRRWTTSVPRPVITIGLGAAATGIAGLAGWFASGWLPAHTPVPDAGWLDRLRIDLPLSAALATTIVTWRWSGTATRRRK
ncbi:MULTISPECIES: hypothetical protein [unclassified Streptomyces]|uniref:hypothetical protein n=1 Tax=unclassified Streptomyces TaxID=2593676 RepID=UPI002DDA6E21|nr:hypothetical protein [Streptomyces sp. NBC_01237]WRZ74868.1 hypothetical protein OG251_26450 [Streptomyces sp. NBC_01237]